MKYEKNRKILGMDELTIMKMLKLLALPIITVILIIVIIIADHTGGKADKPTTTMQTSTTAEDIASSTNSSIAPDNNQYIQDFANYGLQKDAIPEITELVLKYQQAKIDADALAMYSVFGRTDTDGMESMQTKMDEEADAYEAYEDTACYTTAGVEDNSYIVYISSNLKFKGIDTPAPMLTWAYVVRDDTGTYHMKEPDTLTEEEQARVDEISVSEDVKVLDSQMRTQLAQAVVSDTKLAALYQMLSEGATTGADGESMQETTETQAPEETESVEEASVSIVQ